MARNQLQQYTKLCTSKQPIEARPWYLTSARNPTGTLTQPRTYAIDVKCVTLTVKLMGPKVTWRGSCWCATSAEWGNTKSSTYTRHQQAVVGFSAMIAPKRYCVQCIMITKTRRVPTIRVMSVSRRNPISHAWVKIRSSRANARSKDAQRSFLRVICMPFVRKRILLGIHNQ